MGHDPPGDGPGAPRDEGDRFVTLARCSSAVVGDFVRSLLDQAGIESVLQDQYLSQVFAFLTGPIGGVRVQVRLRDMPAALEVLRHPPQPLAADGAPDLEGGAVLTEVPTLQCPECGSGTVSFEPAEPEGFLIRWLEQLIPLPFLHGHWECDACGKRWLELSGPRG
jgi:hypothetical protein